MGRPAERNDIPQDLNNGQYNQVGVAQGQQEAGPSRHVYGSPNRAGANIHTMHQVAAPNDFFSKFGQGGNGAPMRD